MALSDRQKTLARIGNLLNTPDGKVLMEELARNQDAKLLGASPQETGFLIGRADVYRELKTIQEAKFHE